MTRKKAYFSTKPPWPRDKRNRDPSRRITEDNAFILKEKNDLKQIEHKQAKEETHPGSGLNVGSRVCVHALLSGAAEAKGRRERRELIVLHRQGKAGGEERRWSHRQ